MTGAPDLAALTATVHPSSVLCAPRDRRQAAYDFVADLAGIATILR